MIVAQIYILLPITLIVGRVIPINAIPQAIVVIDDDLFGMSYCRATYFTDLHELARVNEVIASALAVLYYYDCTCTYICVRTRDQT